MSAVYFVSGIDTDVGKSYATGFLAREWQAGGKRTITQKLVQTGGQGLSEDVRLHRQLMGTRLLREDEEGLTTPAIFPFPASPHLAARLAGQSVDCSALTRATQGLAARYDVVLVEGAGGLMVPLTETVLTIDYIRDCGYPVVLVTSGRLGSINHTLLSLEALKARGMRLHALVYNAFPLGDATIRRDTKAYFQNVLAREWPDAALVLLPFMTGDLARRLRADV